MTPIVDIRIKLTPDQSEQWRADRAVICSTIGNLPPKFIALLAVHRWANQIRQSKDVPETEGTVYVS